MGVPTNGFEIWHEKSTAGERFQGAKYVPYAASESDGSYAVIITSVHDVNANIHR